MFLLFFMHEKKGVAQHGESSDKGRVSAASFVFKQAGVFPPVIAYFYAAPVATNELQPFLGGSLVEGFRGEVVANLFFVRFVGARFSPNFYDGLDVRESDLHGRDALDGNFASIDPPMRFFGLGKRGERFFALSSAS